MDCGEQAEKWLVVRAVEVFRDVDCLTDTHIAKAKHESHVDD